MKVYSDSIRHLIWAVRKRLRFAIARRAVRASIQASKPCGCPDDGTVCLHGLSASAGVDEPLTHRVGDYLGIDRSGNTSK